MFKTPESRTALRAGFASLLSGIAAASAIWVDNPYIRIAGVVASTLGLWYGVGHQTPIEPFLGKAGDPPVEVPAERVTTT